MDPDWYQTIRMMRKALEMIEADLTRQTPPHVDDRDDRDEAYHLAGRLKEMATKLGDQIGNTST